jgi:hypothetical protein
MLAVLFSLSSCGYGPAASTAITCTVTAATTSTAASSNTCTDPVTGISLTIAPASVSVNVVTSYQFSAAPSGSTDIVITWQVNGKAGGDDTVGRIDSNGLYHAPNAVPSGGTVNVIAQLYDEPALTASSTVTILAAPTVTIAPTSWSMPSGTLNTKQFTSTVTGTTTSNVDWFVGNALGMVKGGNATFGTINSSGLYSAPATPPIGSSVIVTAVSRDFPLASAGAPVTLTGYSTSSLTGRFAFSVSGQILSGAAAGPFSRAGSFTADGVGHLSGALEDINDASGVTSAYSFIGSYSVSADGRGVLKFTDATATPANLPAIFDFVLVNGTQLQITGFDASGTATYAGTASGQANAQDNTTFSNAGLSGTYVFDFAGVHGGNSLSLIGEFTSDGAGDITGGSFDTSDGGTFDDGTLNQSNPFQVTGNTAAPFTPPVYPSTYSVSSTGRGTLTLATNDPSFPTLTFSFYIVSRGSAKFVEIDTAQTQIVAGATMQQAPNGTFDVTALNAQSAFLLTGLGPGGVVVSATAGSFTAGANGLITTGTLDENLGGVPSINNAFSGSYTVASNGRGTMTFIGGRTYVFYLGPTGSAVFQETDINRPEISIHGMFIQQQTAAFTLASIQGNYSINSNGALAVNGQVQVMSGQVAANGAGAVTSGEIDINTAGTLTPAEAVSGTYLLPAASGRTTLVLNPTGDNRNFAVYVVNSAQAIIMGIDVGRVAAGALLRQF